MTLRTTIEKYWHAFSPYLGVAAFVVLCGALFWLFPVRTAAVLLGILVAVAVHVLYLSQTDRAARLGVFWAAVAVTTDAAYARLNDQTPVTIVGGIAKFTESLVKLGEGLIRGAGVHMAESRAKLAPVTPDFYWALILTLILLMVISFFAQRR